MFSFENGILYGKTILIKLLFLSRKKSFEPFSIIAYISLKCLQTTCFRIYLLPNISHIQMNTIESFNKRVFNREFLGIVSFQFVLHIIQKLSQKAGRTICPPLSFLMDSSSSMRYSFRYSNFCFMSFVVFCLKVIKNLALRFMNYCYLTRNTLYEFPHNVLTENMS